MKTLSKRMNMKFGTVEGAHVMAHVNLGMDVLDTLCLICSKLDINLKNIKDSDFRRAASILKKFVNSANEVTGYTVSA